MYKYFQLEASFELGHKTVMDVTSPPPVVSELHLVLQIWQGDDLMSCFPCFIVTERLRRAIEDKSFSGVTFQGFLLTLSESLQDMYEEVIVPQFWWMKIHGHQGGDDFSISSDFDLVVSERANDVLQEFQLDFADYEVV